MFFRLAILFVAAVGLTGCTAGLVAVQSTADTISAPISAAGAQFRKDEMDFICRQFGGARQGFTPDLSKGAVVYTKHDSTCGASCQEKLLAGFAFVDVVRDQPAKVMRYRRTAGTCEGAVGCVQGKHVAKIRGEVEDVLFEATWPRPGYASDLENNRRHLGQISNKFRINAEQIDGRFVGQLNRTTGKINGYGAFSLWRAKAGLNLRLEDRKAVIRSCPDLSTGTAASAS
ncbi:MAG: hypothetical protein AAF830_07440 [Pseudomonadota bacterium]